ncbi:unnamed protein product [Hyaloperonospora brassicae]|uniref:DUF7769 domain-containing protein n=1 Tax=Hyaloperonospora brassicae TaxID=162125 RepID=A0AAV0UKF6_HYABA|nr:unnamed protein product [Hyaloperonospora brassicae]
MEEPSTDTTRAAWNPSQAMPVPLPSLPTPFEANVPLASLPVPEVSVTESTKLLRSPQEVPTKLLDMAFVTPIATIPMERSEDARDTVLLAESMTGKRKNLTDQQRAAIVHYLLANSAAGRLKHGDIKAAAIHFGVHRATIRRLWKLYMDSSVTDGLAGNVASRIKGRSGRKPKVSDEELKRRIAAIPAERRMTGRGLSTALEVSNSVVVRLIKTGKLRRHPKKLHYIM